ncbi:MAG: polysulfide reductase NrfD [Burkholderiales bacterium]|jgi:formate-dependent nitrite reductase membrane component NrfD|nr:polysulfide reductase NrfD [Burkholderiales bacterium]
MLEFTTTRHNPGIDPALHVWGWEIPLYLFVGGMVAGMMIFAGAAMLRTARGEDTRSFFSVQTPLLGFMLLNLGMLALLLDLAHPLYVWAIYITFQPLSPMSWGSWVLLIVYGILLVSALVRLPESWPWLGERVPALKKASDWFVGSPKRMRQLGVANIAFGIGVGIYTGILLNTMVARPLWNTSVLPLLFLVSGLSAAAAAVHLATVVFPGRPAPRSLIGGMLAAMTQPLGPQPPEKRTVDTLVRADIVLLAVELVLIALLLMSLATSTLSQIEAVKLLFAGSYGLVFWVGVIAIGIVVPIVLQALELSHRIPHTVLPAVLVLVGGFALRWVLVNAGQASEIVSTAARL